MIQSNWNHDECQQPRLENLNFTFHSTKTFKFSVKMSSNFQQRIISQLSQLQHEKNKLEDELQALLEEIGKTSKDNKEWKKQLLSRKTEIEAKVKKMVEEIDSMGPMVLQEINRMTTPQSIFSRYSTQAFMVLVVAGFMYLLVVWMAWNFMWIEHNPHNLY